MCLLSGAERAEACSPSSVTGGSSPPEAARMLVYFSSAPREGWPAEGARNAEITKLLKARRNGDEAALPRLTERVYPEPRLMARRFMKSEGQSIPCRPQR